MADIDIDQDDDYANDVKRLRREAAMIKVEQIDDFADDERSIRRLRRNSAKVTYSTSSRSRKGKKREVDDNYALFLNFYESQGKCSSFESKDDVDSDFDLQYYKFLSFLKPVNVSYALDLVRGDGTSELFTYEDVNETSDQLVHNANPNVTGEEENGGMLDIGKRMCFKSTDKPSVTLGRSVTDDKIGEENAGHPCLEESFIVGSEYTSLKSMGTDSQMRSVDVSYQFYLYRNFSLKLNSVKDAYGDPKSRLTNRLRQNMGRKNEGKRSHCRKLGNSRQKEFPDKTIQKDAGMHVSNDKQSKRRKLAEDNKDSGRRSLAPKGDQEGNGTAVPLRVKPNDKLGKNNWLSGISKQTSKRKLVDGVAEDTTGLHTLHAVQTSGKKPRPKNHNQPGSELKFDRPINISYKTFLSGLRDKEGHLVFQSEEGNVVTYEKVLKESSTDSESDSDSVIITGERVNGRHRKYCSFVTSKSSPQGLELDKNRTSNNSPFRKKLMNILRKPYDQEEYKSLMEMAKKRKPLEGYRDLRSGRNGTYELECLGKSYLDHHKDVAEAISRCKGDRQKILVILRGFIYWLEHVPDANLFQPWKDKECLEVQPRKSNL